MRFRITKLIFKVVISAALVLLLKSIYFEICKLTCKLQKNKCSYVGQRMNNKQTKPTLVKTVLKRSKIDEENSWASYQRNVIIKQLEKDEERKQHLNTTIKGNIILTELTEIRKTKSRDSESSKSKPDIALVRFLVDKKEEETNEFDSGVLENKAKSRERTEEEITRESVRFQQKDEIKEDGKRKREDKGKRGEVGEKTEENEAYESGAKRRKESEDTTTYKQKRTPAASNVTNKKLKTKASSQTQRFKLNASRKSHRPVKKKVVLFYTSLFDRIPWPDLENSENFTQFRGKPCAVRNCEITYDKSRILESDAVLFHCRDLPSPEEMKQLPRQEKQRWIFFTHENPVFTYKNLTHYNHFFNWTMSYRSDSDFFVPYNYYSRLDTDDFRSKTKVGRSLRSETELTAKHYAEGKDKLVAWMVGNCGQLRDKVVSKLTKYINVTIFGACSRKFNQSENRCAHGSRDCKKLLRRFKFYLSFENQMCIDYVTEKYWYTPFEHDMVPVVLGSNYGSNVAVPGSFINVLDFPSLKSLARYLQYLDRNDTAYNEYFKWKTKYKIDYPLSVVWTCNLCAALNNDSLPHKIYHDLDLFWGPETTCGRNRDKINALLKDN